MEIVDKSLLNGKSLRVASVEIPPYVELVQDDNGNIVQGRGFCFEILHTLMDLYNFTITIEVPKDKAYGAKMADGTWNGMISMILNNESDIAVGSFSVTHVRYQAIDFTVAFHEESSAILIPAPIHGNPSSAFIKPFQLQVWIVLITILGLLPSIMWFLSKFLERGRLSSIRKSQRDKRVLFVYGVLLTQSGQKIPGNEKSVRFLAIVWCLSAMVFIHAYVGTLISFLSVPTVKPIIRSLEDLPSSGLGWFVWRGSDLESLFLEATEGVSHVIGNGLRKHPERLINSIKEGEQAVSNGSFVFMNNQATIVFLAEKDYLKFGTKSRLSVAKETFYKVNQAFVLPKGSPIGRLFNKKITTMVESGLVKHWRMKYLSKKYYSSGSKFYGKVLRRLKLDDVESAFVIWSFGATIAFVAFMSENCVKFARKTFHF